MVAVRVFMMDIIAPIDGYSKLGFTMCILYFAGRRAVLGVCGCVVLLPWRLGGSGFPGGLSGALLAAEGAEDGRVGAH